MGYDYLVEKHKILNDEGQRKFLKVRNRAQKLLQEAGAFKMFAALKDISGDTWEMMAYVDRMVELGEIKEITGKEVWGQERIFVKPNG